MDGLDIALYDENVNFDKFQYRNRFNAVKENDFIADCKNVIKTARNTYLGTVKLGCLLAKIKQSGVWKEVINPDDGNSFNYSSFQAFSKYAYGFGSTFTSDLLSLSEFATYDEKLDVVIFNSEEYAKMNKSKLIALAPLPQQEREMFRADMTVAEIRLCKKYMDEGSADYYSKRYKDGFDLLAAAQEWQEAKEQEQERRTVQAVDEELQRAAKAQTQAPSAGEERAEYADYEYDESFYEKDEVVYYPPSEILTSGFSEPEQAQRKYDFSTREKVMKFLSEYESWQTVEWIYTKRLFDKIKRYRFENGAELYAATCIMCVNASYDGSEKPLLFYFLSLGEFAQPIKISKLKLWAWLRAHENELGVSE